MLRWIIYIILSLIGLVALGVWTTTWLVDQLLGPVGIIAAILAVSIFFLGNAVNEASEKARSWSFLCGILGAVVMGWSGCASCLNNPVPPGDFPFPPFSFNLFTGTLIGAVAGFAIGLAIGKASDD